MRILTILFTVLTLSASAYAEDNDFQATTNKALTAGSSEAVIKALDKEIYRGNIVAAKQLGLMYRDGTVVPKDPAKARKYLKTAATGNLTRIWYRHGIAEAQRALADMLLAGVGGKADPSGAESWYLEAAEQGDARAQLALAKLYFNGAGIKRDLASAYLWSSIAAGSLSEAEQTEAAQLRDQSQAQLEPTQLAKTKGQISKWKARAA